jgi:hypothetical protein
VAYWWCRSVLESVWRIWFCTLQRLHIQKFISNFIRFLKTKTKFIQDINFLSHYDSNLKLSRTCRKCSKIKNKFWEELIAYFPSIQHRLLRKRRVQQFCCCVCWLPRYLFTEPLPSNGMGIHIQTHRLIDGRDLWNMALRWAQVPWYIHTKFHKRLIQAFKSWWWGYFDRHRQEGDRIAYFRKVC